MFKFYSDALLPLSTTVDNMKRLGLRASYLSTDKNAEAGTKRSQTTEPQLFYIVCCAFVLYFFSKYSFK